MSNVWSGIATFLGHWAVRESVGRRVPHPPLPGVDEFVDLGHVTDIGVGGAEGPDASLGRGVFVPGKRFQLLNS